MTLFEQLLKGKNPYEVITPPSLKKSVASTTQKSVIPTYANPATNKTDATINQSYQYGGVKDFYNDVIKKSVTDFISGAKKVTEMMRPSSPEEAKKQGMSAIPTGDKENPYVYVDVFGAIGGIENVSKNIFKSIAKEVKPEMISGLLKKLGGIADNLIPELSQKLSKVTKPTEVENIIKPFLTAEKVLPKVVTEINPLAEEARKYKSADEFVKKIQGSATQYGDYTPELRGYGMGDYKNITELGVKPDEMVTIYRGIDDTTGKIPKKINDGDFVTTDYDSAWSYAGDNKVVSMEVPAKTLYTDAIEDFKSDPFYIGSEYVYTKQKVTPMSESQLTDIYNQAVKTAPEVKLGGTVASKVERGFITSAKEAVPEAQKIGGQYIPRNTDNLAIKAKNLVKTDINTAEKLALTGTDDTAVATASELLKHYASQAEKATDVAIKNALYDKAAQVANTIAPKLTESGRSIQAASILGRLTPEGQVRFAAGQISKYNEGANIAKKIPELTGEQTNYILNEMKAINDMVGGVEKAMKFQKLQDYISKLVPTPLFKKIITVWKAGLLTGLKTSGLNIMANLSHAGTETVKDIPATIIDKSVSLFTGKRTVSVGLRGIPEGVKEGIQKGLQYIKTGFDERNIATKLDYEKVNFGKGKISQALQTYTDTVFKILGTEDQPFYYSAKIRSLYEQAKVEAINKGLKGNEAQKFINELIQNPTDKMVKYASLDAEMAVFQNTTLLSKASSGITKAIPAAEVIMPFRKTPSAVAMQIFNYSPAGIVKTLFENVGKGKFDQRLFSQGLGRGLTGTGVLALGALLYKKGLITTSRPTGEREQKLWELEGKQPNSIKLGGKWRQVQVLGPVGNVLLIGGGFQKAFNETGSPTEALSVGLADASQSFTQQTFLTGVSNFIDAISDPSRSASSVAGSTLASTVPTIVSDIARATDEKERRANTITDKFFARIPGVRQTLEPQVNVLGQEKQLQNPLEIMLDPTRPLNTQDTPVINEFRRLADLGFKVSPTLLGDKNGYKSLTPEQNTQLWKRVGEITNSKLNNLFNTEDYNNLSDEEKGKKVESFVSKSQVNARAEMVINLTQGLKNEELKSKLSELKKSGLMTREVYNRYLEIK
jgi:hypothetical protein